MQADSQTILGHLNAVGAERDKRNASPALHAAVLRVKAYQQRRFSHTYADLLASPRYRGATRFFLDELYGPRDFTQRDAQFARVVPALVRLFPQPIVDTVATLAGLHALSEVLDTETAAHATGASPLTAGAAGAADALGALDYLDAWQQTGRVADRTRQIALLVDVGRSLDRITRNPLLRHSLRLMRPAARAAGLGELQQFLETGFDTFKAMRGADAFLATVESRERELAQSLFEADATDPVAMKRLLQWLPRD